jgi:hypothetical protein
MLELWLKPQLLQDKPSVAFQHDGAPSYTHNEVTTFMNKQLREQRIGQAGPLPGLCKLQT